MTANYHSLTFHLICLFTFHSLLFHAAAAQDCLVPLNSGQSFAGLGSCDETSVQPSGTAPSPQASNTNAPSPGSTHGPDSSAGSVVPPSAVTQTAPLITFNGATVALNPTGVIFTGTDHTPYTIEPGTTAKFGPDTIFIDSTAAVVDGTTLPFATPQPLSFIGPVVTLDG